MNDKDFAKRVCDLFVAIIGQKAFGNLVIDVGEVYNVMTEAERRSKNDQANATAIAKSDVSVMAGNGAFYNPFDLTCLDFSDFRPIATALSRICRFWGQTSEFYSVAQHCVVLSRYFAAKGEMENAKWALMHETAEAFLGDLPTPIKKAFPAYKELENQILERMAKCLGLPYPMPEAVHIADKRLMFDEALQLMPNKEYWLTMSRESGIEPLGIGFNVLTHRDACKAFLRLANK